MVVPAVMSLIVTVSAEEYVPGAGLKVGIAAVVVPPLLPLFPGRTVLPQPARLPNSKAAKHNMKRFFQRFLRMVAAF